MKERANINWPEGKGFAFTIFDDTDRATLVNNKLVYDLLARAGLRTTKSVWAFDGDSPAYIPGITCDNMTYVEWLQKIQSEGFEIAWHNATWETSPRDRTHKGLNRFRELFGHDPNSAANHASNEESIYWGCNRLSGWRRGLWQRFPRAIRFSGHDESSPLFWGDFCQERIRYVRNFTFRGINTLHLCPEMPYHDAKKPWVREWFAASCGSDVSEFNQLLQPESLDQLESEGGACIVYTHFGKGFQYEAELHPTFRERIEDLSSRNGWFVPVSKLLDFLAQSRGGSHQLTGSERRNLELRWLADRVAQAIRP